MRIERLRLDAFGRLSVLDTGAHPLPGLVVVLGPNEAGKSTIFHFLTSMLYGFHPASRDTNPYAPWDGSDPGGAVTLRLDAGACVEIERRLLSQPWGRMTTGGLAEDLRNRTLPWAEHVPRTVFRQVYALTLAELAGLDEETWGRVQDRIVGSMGATDLRPARHVVAELEQEAGELWRPNRRGNQRIRALQESIRSLRESRRSAADVDRRLREAVLDAEACRARLQDVRQARHLALMAVEHVQALVPVRAQLRRIDTLRGEAAPLDELKGMPSDPPRELDALRERVAALRGRLEELDAERTTPEAAVAAFGSAERRLLEHGDHVIPFVSRAARLASERARLSALEHESRDLARRIDTAASPILTTSGDDLPAAPIAAVPIAELRGCVRRLDAVREERRVLEASAAAEARPDAPTPTRTGLLAGAVLLLLGIVLLGVALAGANLAVTAVGAAATTLGVALLVERLRVRAGSGERASDVRHVTRLAAARAAEEAARSAVADLVAGLPLHPSVAEDPTEALTAGLERIQELLRDREERVAAVRDLSERVAEADEEGRTLAGRLGMDPALDAETLARSLELDLRRAERLQEAAASAEREIGRLDRERARVSGELSRTAATLDDLTRRLEAAGGGDAVSGARRIHERIRAAERAGQLEQELEHAHPDLEEIRARILEAEAAGDSWTVDADDLARRKARVEELGEEAEALAARAEARDRDAAHLREAETVDAVDGAIAALQEEEQALLIERDRRWVLSRLLRQADRRFREEHQHDLMRRAGTYLAALTGGRYHRIVADESSGNGRFQILGPGAPAATTLAPPVSTGTLEQAYLSLRLAIVDHLDQGLERLPLFVDEVFVNWDAARRACGMDLLADVAGRRQVFAFTCHADVARELERRGGLVLPLGDDG